MTVNTNLNTKRFSKNRNIWLIVLLLFGIEFVWKPAFISGKTIGIYWLFVLIDRALFLIQSMLIFVLPILLGLAIVLFLVFIFMRFGKKDNYSLVGKISLASFICALFLIAEFLFSLTTFHFTSLRVQNKVYYLAGYDGFMYQANALYRCDSLGIFCKQVRFWGGSTFMSGSVPNLSKVHGILGFNKETSEIQIWLPDGASYQYKVQ